jgi:hypothetical protein
MRHCLSVEMIEENNMSPARRCRDTTPASIGYRDGGTMGTLLSQVNFTEMAGEVMRLRAEAERCRRLAANMHHAATEKMLRKTADELDEEADRLNSSIEVPPGRNLD